MIAYRDIGSVGGAISEWIASKNAGGDLLSDVIRKAVRETVQSVAEDTLKLPVSHLLSKRIQRLLEQVEGDGIETFTYSAALDALKDLSNDILVEFQRPLFLMIPDDKVDYYLEQAPFGDDVLSKFPSAAYDIAHAARCISLDEWVAVVMYSMRALEPALRYVGSHLGIKVASTIEYQDWSVIIQGIEAAIKALPSGAKAGSAAAKKKIQYADIAAHLFHVKEAWRNPVMHARSSYDEEKAMDIYRDARSILQSVARMKRR